VINPFFKNNGPFIIDDILSFLNLSNSNNYKADLIYDVTDLSSAKKNELTFFHSKKYSLTATKTKASYCLTLKSLKDYLPKECKKIFVDNVLLSISQITSKFYL